MTSVRPGRTSPKETGERYNPVKAGVRNLPQCGAYCRGPHKTLPYFANRWLPYRIAHGCVVRNAAIHRFGFQRGCLAVKIQFKSANLLT